MGQTWANLLFAHWAVQEEELRAHVPESLELDLYDGTAYLGITPFEVTGLRMRGTLPLPRVSTFLGLNVRTYVTDGVKPGTWFFSLDCSSRLAVEAAKLLYHLPYFQARISQVAGPDGIVSECVREQGHRVWSATYRPEGEVFHALPRSLEHFLAERYWHIHRRPPRAALARRDPPCAVAAAGRGGPDRAEHDAARRR